MFLLLFFVDPPLSVTKFRLVIQGFPVVPRKELRGTFHLCFPLMIVHVWKWPCNGWSKTIKTNWKGIERVFKKIVGIFRLVNTESIQLQTSYDQIREKLTTFRGYRVHKGMIFFRYAIRFVIPFALLFYGFLKNPCWRSRFSRIPLPTTGQWVSKCIVVVKIFKVLEFRPGARCAEF